MEIKKIETLLQRYFEALTSFEEEAELIRYFEEHETPPEWNWAKEQLLGFADLQDLEIPIPEDLDSSILKQLAPFQEDKKIRRIGSNGLISLLSIAASIMLIASALIFINRQPDVGNIEDPELAYAETKQALDLVSKYFNQGTEKLVNLNKMEEAVKPLDQLKRVDETRNTLQMLNNFDKGIETTQGLLKLEDKKSK